jgi:hypothetical protein
MVPRSGGSGVEEVSVEGVAAEVALEDGGEKSVEIDYVQ